MLAKTPPMGWNSWNTFGKDISDSLIRETADAFIDQGLKDAGYEYVVIDDCWSKMQREDGRLVADPVKFPGGMKALADYVHGKGLKFGMYSCAGLKTCASYPSSFEHEFVDAQTFADWGVDYLKYDFCNTPDKIDGSILYRRMSMALRNCGRDILFSACSWGSLEEEKWIRGSGAHIWRSTGDINDSWASIKDIVRRQDGKECYSGPGCFNDPDMLVVGMYGKGNVGVSGCTDEEYRTHFSLWCMMNAPLMIGCDVRNMSAAAKEILTNKEVIALNQDEEGRQAYIASNNHSYNLFYAYVKPLANGEYAICLVNFWDDEAGLVELYWWDIGLPGNAGYGFQLRDLWSHEDLGVFPEGIQVRIPSHGCKVYRAKLVKL